MLLYFLWLSLVKGIGPVAVKRLLAHFSGPEEIYEAELEDLLRVEGIGKVAATSLVEARSLREASTILERCQKKNIRILTCLDEDYPDSLHDIPRAPALLYYSGIAPKKGGVALVGSRKCSAYGKEVACEAASYLARHNVPVLSGMAAGIDGYAHTACLKAGGYTIAFLGGGVDTVYPSEHRELKEKIAASGTLLSFFPPGTPAHPSRFPSRNFLMAAWADTILLVEAGKKSGALLIAEYGMKLSKKVMAVPGSIYSGQSVGTNALLGRGAEVYCSPEQLYCSGLLTYGDDKSGFSSANARAKKTEIHGQPEDVTPQKSLMSRTKKLQPDAGKRSASESDILQLLETSPMSMDQLALHFRDNRSSFFEALTMLELDGLLKRLPGGIISLTRQIDEKI